MAHSVTENGLMMDDCLLQDGTIELCTWRPQTPPYPVAPDTPSCWVEDCAWEQVRPCVCVGGGVRWCLCLCVCVRWCVCACVRALVFDFGIHVLVSAGIACADLCWRWCRTIVLVS